MFRLLALGTLFLAATQARASTNVVSKADLKEAVSSATSSVQSPSIMSGVQAAQAGIQSVGGSENKTQGLQFKDPVVSATFMYRYYHDSFTPAGFSGNDYSGDLGLDADIYDGLVAGATYNHLSRGGSNILGANEDMDSNGFSLYLAKRWLEILNTGLAYNYATIHHNLNGSVAADLDRDSNGFTVFAGVSDKIDVWYYSSAAVFAYAADDYHQQSDLDSGLLTWTNEITYDVSKQIAAGLVFSYNHFIIQDTFAGTTAADDQYWMVGPILHVYVTDNLTLNVQMGAQLAYKDYDAYSVSLGGNYAF